MIRVAYLVGRYPGVSHTFIQREIVELRKLGVDVTTFSIWQTPDEALLSDGDRREAALTQNLLPLRGGPTLRAHREALKHPHAYARLVSRALSLGPPGVRRSVLSSSWIAESVALWSALRNTPTRHVHAHLGGTAPTVAMLTTELGNLTRDGTRWTWSLTVHGPDEFADVARERLREKVESATFVAAISDFTRSQLLRLVDPSHWSKTHVVHCGVDLDAFAPRPETTTGHANGSNGSLNVLSVGRLSSAKAHDVLLEAIALSDPCVNLTIVGDGDRRADLERSASALGIADRVTFAGAVGQDHIRSYFAAADVFCLPSFAEGVPVVLMEAMAMEMPVVTTGLMGIPELVEHRKQGLLVRPGRADQVADALSRLASQPEVGAAMGRAGRRKVAREFDIRKSAAQLRDLFAGVTGV